MLPYDYGVRLFDATPYDMVGVFLDAMDHKI